MQAVPGYPSWASLMTELAPKAPPRAAWQMHHMRCVAPVRLACTAAHTCVPCAQQRGSPCLLLLCAAPGNCSTYPVAGILSGNGGSKIGFANYELPDSSPGYGCYYDPKPGADSSYCLWFGTERYSIAMAYDSVTDPTAYTYGPMSWPIASAQYWRYQYVFYQVLPGGMNVRLNRGFALLAVHGTVALHGTL